MVMNDICSLSLHELSGSIRSRVLSPVEVVEAHLGRIEALNPKINAFTTVCAEEARAAAREAEAEIARGHHRGPLHGIPFGAKDIFDTAGVRTTHGSRMFRGNIPGEDAESIRRLKEAGGHPPREVQHPRLRRRDHPELRLRTHPESLGAGPRPRGLERRLGGGAGGPSLSRRDRVRHGRIHPGARFALRCGGVQAHVWKGEFARRFSPRADARSRGPLRPHGARLRALPARDGRLRSLGPGFEGRARA